MFTPIKTLKIMLKNMVKLKISNFKFALIFLVYFISLQVIELNHTFFDVFKFFSVLKKKL